MMRQTPDTALWTVVRQCSAETHPVIQYYLLILSNGYEEKIGASPIIHMPAVCCDILKSSPLTNSKHSPPQIAPSDSYNIDISLASTCHVVAPFDLEVPRRSTTRSYPPLKYLGNNQLQEAAGEAATMSRHA